MTASHLNLRCYMSKEHFLGTVDLVQFVSATDTTSRRFAFEGLTPNASPHDLLGGGMGGDSGGGVGDRGVVRGGRDAFGCVGGALCCVSVWVA